MVNENGEIKCGTCKKELPLHKYTPYYQDKGHGRCRDCEREYNVIKNQTRHFMFNKRYPVVSKNIVYCFKENDEVIYVGYTTRGSQRIYEHYNHKPGKCTNFFAHDENPLQRQKRFRYEVLFHCEEPDHSLLRNKEKELIKSHKPKYNKTWVKES